MRFRLGELALRVGDLTQKLQAFRDSYFGTDRLLNGEAFFEQSPALVIVAQRVGHTTQVQQRHQMCLGARRLPARAPALLHRVARASSVSPRPNAKSPMLRMTKATSQVAPISRRIARAALEQGARLFRVGAQGGVEVAVHGDLIGCAILLDSRAAALQTADLLVNLAEPGKEPRLRCEGIGCQALTLRRFLRAAFRRSDGVDNLLQECDGLEMTRADCHEEGESDRGFPQPFPLPTLERPLPGAAHILELTFHLVQGMPAAAGLSARALCAGATPDRTRCGGRACVSSAPGSASSFSAANWRSSSCMS